MAHLPTEALTEVGTARCAVRARKAGATKIQTASLSQGCRRLYRWGPTVNTPFTVTPGASVLVVILEDRQGGTVLSEPATISWNGYTLTQDTNSLANASNYRSMAMYHLFAPPPGSGNITATYSAANNTILLCAYTLIGVNTNIAPIILQTNSTGTTSLSGMATGVAAGSWASVGSIWGATGEPLARH